MTVNKATTIGMLWVNGPVMLIMFGGWLGAWFGLMSLAKIMPPLPGGTMAVAIGVALAVLCIVTPFVAAWLWWSFQCPKWRIWAAERVDDKLELEREAIQCGLIWDENSLAGAFFAKTEIWSARDRRRYADLKHGHRLDREE